MKKVTRKTWLEELLTGLFEVKHVKLDNVYLKNECVYDAVVYDKGWLQSVKCTGKYCENYIRLFKRVLLDDETAFYNDANILKKGYNKRRIMENAKMYFKNYGFDEEKYSINYSTNDLGRLFYKIILTEIVPIVFEIGKNIEEDISDRYNKQLERIKSLFSAPDLDDIFYNNAQNKDVDVILDYELYGDKKKADIAIPIDRSNLNFRLVMPWKKNAVELTTKPANTQFRAWSERTDLSLDELMEKWVKYPYDPEGMFIKPWDSWLDGFSEKCERKKYCPITNTAIKYFDVLSRYVYFVTNKQFFAKCSSYGEMKLLINERIKETLLQDSDGKIYSYYRSIAEEIEEMIGLISSVNMDQLIEHSKDSYKEIVLHFNLDPDLAYASCAFDLKNEDDIINSVYNILEKEIYDFAMRIENSCDELAKNLKEYLSKIKFDRHMNVVTNFIEDKQLAEFIQQIDTKLEDNDNKIYTPRNNNDAKSMITKLNYVFSPKDNYLRCLKKALEKYCTSLKESSSEEDMKLSKDQPEANNESKVKYVYDDPGYNRRMKEDIDNEIGRLRKPLKAYLQNHYYIIRQLIGKAEKNDVADLELYYKLRAELFSFEYTFTPLYPRLLEMEQEIKSLVNTGAELSNDNLNKIIDYNLSKYRMSFSIYQINDETEKR